MTISSETLENGEFTYPLSHHDIHIWALQLYIMLSAGISLITSLESMAKGSLPRLATTCELLTQRILAGSSLTGAMTQLRPAFSPLAINLVSIGEHSGQLSSVLQRLSLRASRQEKIERMITSTLAYPVFLSMVSLGMALFMAFYMFPKLLPFLLGLGVTLPWPTQALIWGVENLSSGVLIITIFCVGLARLLGTSEDSRMRSVRDSLVFNLPVTGEVARQRVYADCFSDLHLLLEAGCDLHSSLKAVHSNWPEFNQRKAECLELLRAGSNLSEAVESSSLFPRTFLLQMTSGEETGKLPRVFEMLSQQLDETVTMRISQLMQLLEPTIFLLMGVITGFVVLATFMPLYGVVATGL